MELSSFAQRRSPLKIIRNTLSLITYYSKPSQTLLSQVEGQHNISLAGQPLTNKPQTAPF